MKIKACILFHHLFQNQKLTLRKEVPHTYRTETHFRQQLKNNLILNILVINKINKNTQGFSKAFLMEMKYIFYQTRTQS